MTNQSMVAISGEATTGDDVEVGAIDLGLRAGKRAVTSPRVWHGENSKNGFVGGPEPSWVTAEVGDMAVGVEGHEGATVRRPT